MQLNVLINPVQLKMDNTWAMGSMHILDSTQTSFKFADICFIG